MVSGALAAFRATQSRPRASLGDALMAALEAGATQGGDRRCPRQQAALTAFIAIARTGDARDVPHLWLATPPQKVGAQAPVELLRLAYDAEVGSLARVDPDGDGISPAVWWAAGVVGVALVAFALSVARRRRRRPR